MSSKNPYGQAVDAYGSTAAITDQRSLEGKVLLKAAAQLETLSKRLSEQETVPLEEIDDAITYNRKLWTLFANETMNADHPLPQDIKNNIASLSIFVIRRSNEVMIETTPEKIKALVDINRNIAAGLLKQQSQPAAKTPPAPVGAGGKATDSIA